MKLSKTQLPLSYRTINVILLALIAVSLILVCLAYIKQKQLQYDYQKILSTIQKTAVILDKNSGTSYSKRLLSTQDKYKLNNIGEVEKQAKNIIDQRDALGKALATISNNLELPQKPAPAQFQTLSLSKKATNQLLLLTQKINQRNNKHIKYFTTIAAIIKSPIKDESAFKSANKDLQGYNVPLDELIKKIKSTAKELKTVEEQLRESQNELKQLLKRVDSNSSDRELKSLISEYERQLEELQNKNKQLSSKIGQKPTELATPKSLTKEQAEYEKELLPKLYLRLTGKVIKYDKQWGFAIINLGKSNSLNYTIGQIEKTANVPLPKDKEMYVARNNKFIAKVKVSKVFHKYAIVNLISPTNATIKPGDTVFFPTKSH